MHSVKQIIGAEIESFEQRFTVALKSNLPLLDHMTGYLISHKGKQIRPVFALLCARMGGAINERSFLAALVVEMLHTASLIHDDIIDESMERRGSFSLNAIWNNRPALFCGDILSLKALLLTLTGKDYDILKIYASAIHEIIEGELLQLRKTFTVNVDERVYFKIITAKTAAFFAAACEAGATTTFTDDAVIKNFHMFGKMSGIAFQLKDDMFDYGNSDVGKPLRNDIKDRKVTLPLLFTLNTCRRRLRRELIHLIKDKNKTPDMISFIIEEVKKAGGMQYTHEKMLFYRNEAIQLLHLFPESDIRYALEEQVRYITDRAF
jgi:octaprenyl-diphosphate synthase